MIVNVTGLHSFAKLLAAGAAIAALATAPASAQRMAGDRPDAEDVARTPLDTFNIDAAEIDPVLKAAARDPYNDEGVRTCNDIVARIAELDTVLGADFDIADKTEEDRISTGRVAQSVIGSFIPFRGIIREISGANERERTVQFAYTAGMVRRAYLKGLGQGRGCDYPARPREVRGTLVSEAEED